MFGNRKAKEIIFKTKLHWNLTERRKKVVFTVTRPTLSKKKKKKNDCKLFFYIF